jgi:hypothetical protein
MNEEKNNEVVVEQPVTESEVKEVDQPVVDTPVSNPDSSDTSGSSSNDSVPLKTFLEMKNELKELKRKQAELEDTKVSESTRAYREKMKQKWIDRGYDEEMAKAMADDLTEVVSTLHAGAESNTDRLLKAEVDELSATDDFNDIGSYKDRIVDTIKKGKTAGLEISVEQAYLMMAGKNKLKEIRNKETVINRINNTNKGTGEIPTGQGEKPDNRYQLDADDKKALAQLQKFQPDYGWTAKKYYESVKQIE